MGNSTGPSCCSIHPEVLLRQRVETLRQHARPNAAGLFITNPNGFFVVSGIAGDVTDIDSVDAVAQDLRRNWPKSVGYELVMDHVNEHRKHLGLPDIREDDLPFNV